MLGAGLWHPSRSGWKLPSEGQGLLEWGLAAGKGSNLEAASCDALLELRDNLRATSVPAQALPPAFRGSQTLVKQTLNTQTWRIMDFPVFHSTAEQESQQPSKN